MMASITMRSWRLLYDNTKHAAYIANLNTATSKVGIADDGMTAGLKSSVIE